MQGCRRTTRGEIRVTFHQGASRYDNGRSGGGRRAAHRGRGAVPASAAAQGAPHGSHKITMTAQPGPRRPRHRPPRDPAVRSKGRLGNQARQLRRPDNHLRDYGRSALCHHCYQRGQCHRPRGLLRPRDLDRLLSEPAEERKHRGRGQFHRTRQGRDRGPSRGHVPQRPRGPTLRRRSSPSRPVTSSRADQNPIHQTTSSLVDTCQPLVGGGGGGGGGGVGCGAVHAPSLARHPAARHPDFISCP